MGKHKGPKDKKDKDKKKKKQGPNPEDAEVAAQVAEIEERLQDISREMNNIDAKTRRYAIEAKRAELTNRELERLSDDAKIYRQVGRMWILQTKQVLAQNLQATTALKAVEGQQMRQMRSKLEDRARSEADGLKELVGIDRFKEMFAKAGQEKADPSAEFAKMTAKSKDESAMPIWGKVGNASAPEGGNSTEKEKEDADKDSLAQGEIAESAQTA
mmetsp:Transcript_71246/g.112851  ORF Transcript_71246/g.112851 Transcript_71246/m.112851 type:complete len:215 (+) Transcript_71246:91-735(+)